MAWRKYGKRIRVWWTDPDNGLCSGPGTVTKINGDVYSVKKDDGGEIECPGGELRPLSDMKKFEVSLQHTVELTYEVYAASEEDAEAAARKRYETGDDEGESSEIVGDATMTDCKQLKWDPKPRKPS